MSNDQEKNPRARMVQYGVWANCSNQCDFCLRKERIPISKEAMIPKIINHQIKLMMLRMKKMIS